MTKYKLIIVLVMISLISFSGFGCYVEYQEDEAIYQEVIRDHCKHQPYRRGFLLLDRTFVDGEILPFSEAKRYQMIEELKESLITHQMMEKLKEGLENDLFHDLSSDMINDLEQKSKYPLVISKEMLVGIISIKIITEKQLHEYGTSCEEFWRCDEEFIALSRVGYSEDKGKALVILMSNSPTDYFLKKSGDKWSIVSVVMTNY